MKASYSPVEIDSMIGAVEENMAANPGYGELCNKLGLLYTLKGRFEEAGGQFRQCLTINPADIEARVNLVFLLFQQKKWEEAEKALLDAIRYASEIKDDFDRRDALLDIATSAADMSFLLNKRKLVNLGLQFQDQLTQGQKAYLFGYLSTVLPSEEGTQLMREAMNIANQIKDPITRSKVSLELATLLTSFTKPHEE